MNLSTSQGETIRLPAEFFEGDRRTDPEGPRVDIRDSLGAVRVTGAAPVRETLGVYYCDYTVPVDAPAGTWTAHWTGVIEGRVRSGVDEFEVRPALRPGRHAGTPPPPAATPQPPPTSTPQISRSRPEAAPADFVSSRAGGSQAKAGRPIRRPVGPFRKESGQAATATAVSGAPPKAPRSTGTPAPPKVRRSRRTLKVLLVLAIISVAATAALVGRSPLSSNARSFQLGEEALREGRIDEARSHYLDVLRQDPDNKHAYFNLGLVAQFSNRAAEARDYYVRSLNSDANFLPALFNLAILEDTLGRPAQAEALYRRAVREHPEYAAARYNLGLLLIRHGRTEQGQAEVDRALEMDPTLQPTPTPRTEPAP